MKISNSLNSRSSIAGLHVKDSSKVKSGRGAEFHNHLANAEDSSYEQHLEKIVNNIIRQGEILSKRIDIGELRVYRKLISEFLEVVLGNSKKFSKKSMLDRKGRYKVYAIIKNINAELDLLTQDVMNGEKDNIKLLQRLDDIRGLILDLFM